jgi:seryl-tRNA synthetase
LTLTSYAIAKAEIPHPAKWKKYMEQCFKDSTIVDKALQIDMDWRHLRSTVDALRKEVGKLQKDVIAPKIKAKEDCDAEVAQMKELQKTIEEKKAQLLGIQETRDKVLSRIGNLGISYRVVCLVSGELNGAAVKKKDLEGYFPLDSKPTVNSCRAAVPITKRVVWVSVAARKTLKRRI